MMHRIYKITILTVILFGYPCATFAQDTVFNRVVTVERDYQPEVQEAQAIATTPTFIQYTPQLNPVVYSTFSEPLSMGYSLHALPMSKTHFRPNGPEPLNGLLDGALGHRNTHLLFGYRLRQKNNTSLDLYANHDAYWGKDALSQSAVGVQVTRHFRRAELYFNLAGENELYWQEPLLGMNVLLNAKANIGIKATNNSPFQYRIQTGYNAFIANQLAVEHHVKSHVDLWWTNQLHSAGVKAYVQNTFYSPLDAYTIITSPRHNMRIEPFYAYIGNNIHLHVGVNVDMNVGTGTLLSAIDGLSFAPSPNLHFDWHTDNNVFHIYADAQGNYGLGSWEEYMGYNRYLNVREGLASPEPRAYTPVDAQVGFKIRPIRTLLIDLYGGYAMMQNACNMKTVYQEDALDYQLWFSDYQRWKVGATMHYHYRDILELNVAGNYYFWQNDNTIYDRPNWDARARLDIHFNSQWSIYSDNYFAGSRIAKTTHGDKTIKPMISLNLGGQYIINRWLSVYLQLNDYLNRRDEIFYGYKSQGIHFLLGVKYRF